MLCLPLVLFVRQVLGGRGGSFGIGSWFGSKGFCSFPICVLEHVVSF